MPDRPLLDLDTRLARERADLSHTIDQPPLQRLRERAAARRRHRRTGIGGGALLAVAVAAALVVQPWAGTEAPSQPAAQPTPSAPVYTAAGITINGLTGPDYLHVSGAIVDIEFIDPDHGYVVAQCRSPETCGAYLARTSDGGANWTGNALLAQIENTSQVDLLAFPDGRLLVTVDGLTSLSQDDGRMWWPLPSAPSGPRPSLGAGQVLRARPGPGPCVVEAWGVEYQPQRLAAAPDLGHCWVAASATPDGAWWAGGVRDGRAAVAVTRDGGATWQSVPLDTPAPSGGTVRVATLGSHAYAVLLGPDEQILAIYHSADGGQSFTRTRGEGGQPRALAGDLVPLLDGRLLVTGTDRRWYVSADDGASFTRAEGNLPAVGRVARTKAGYVAYDLFGGGWAAYSADGSTWRKLMIN